MPNYSVLRHLGNEILKRTIVSKSANEALAIARELEPYSEQERGASVLRKGSVRIKKEK